MTIVVRRGSQVAVMMILESPVFITHAPLLSVVTEYADVGDVKRIDDRLLFTAHE